ncbi:MAG TPA: Atu1372/SO_1960 family protein [Solirubrobacteraceae bacterium]|jgi:flavin reductase (DIM6/NTAB) family NADH-FMN oxidoreductase RutF/enamine deaminase RidA (YjgF/YER057c/UK114 family)
MTQPESKELGVPGTTPLGAYVPAVTIGSMVFVSGHTGRTATSPGARGEVGADVTFRQAQDSARQAAANVLAAAERLVGRHRLGSLIQMRGYLRAARDFTDHSAVMDAASEIMTDALGGDGHARAIVGVASLPGGAVIEIEAVFGLTEPVPGGGGEPPPNPLFSVFSTERDDLRRTFSMFPSGVAGVCSWIEGAPAGMAVSSFTCVSLEPPLVSICVDNTSTTWPRVARSARIGVSILSSQHEQLCRMLASRTGDRFSSASWSVTDDGAVLLHGSALWLECEIRNEISVGDHSIVVLEVCNSRLFAEASPLIFHHSRLRPLTVTQ